MARNAVRPEREDRELPLVKTGPGSALRVLRSAELRLTGAMKHREGPRVLTAAAERVRRAQLGRLKATDRIVTPPCELADEDAHAVELERQRTNLEREREAWLAMSVHEILAYYRARGPS